jgi:hypothetical protein
VARTGRLRRRPGRQEDVEDTLDLADRGDRGFDPYDRTPVDPWPGGFRPAATAAPVPRSRVSFWATVGLIISVVALCVTLTGLLALEGLALALIGLPACIAGFIRASRPGVTGRSLAILGLLAALAAAWLAVAALTGNIGWLDSHTDAVSRWRGWLVARWPWLGRW